MNRCARIHCDLEDAAGGLMQNFLVSWLAVAILVVNFISSSLPAVAASQTTKVTIHVPSKSLAIMPYYFGKDKGFFSETIEPQLVVMSPPTAIAALVAGELDFATTLGAATTAIMRGLPLRRLFYVQQEPAHALLVQPEVKTIQDLVGKVIAVTALTDAVGMSAVVILKAHGLDTSRVTLLATQVSDNATKHSPPEKLRRHCWRRLTRKNLRPKATAGWRRPELMLPLAIGLVASTDAVQKNPQKAYALLAGLYRTMTYLHNPANRTEVIQYIASFHKIDPPLAEKAFATQIASYSKDGTKPRKSVEREIEIYRETFKIAKSFTPDDLEDMSLLKRVQEAGI